MIIFLYLNGYFYKTIEKDTTDDVDFFIKDSVYEDVVWVCSENKSWYEKKIEFKIIEISKSQWRGYLNNKKYIITALNAISYPHCIVDKEAFKNLMLTTCAIRYLFPEEVINKNIKKIRKLDLLDLGE